MPTLGHVLCVASDEIEGFIDSVDAATAGGFSFGGVARQSWLPCRSPGRRGQSATPLAVGDLVVADDQLAIGTKVCRR